MGPEMMSGRARLVDEDGVDFVDDREIVAALDHLLEMELHIVAQIVEAELVVGGVGHVAGILLAAFGVATGRARCSRPIRPRNS